MVNQALNEQFARFVLTLTTAIFIIGCGRTISIPPVILPIRSYEPLPSSGLPSKPVDGGSFASVSYVPFVEDVLMPERVYENTPFEVKLLVSAHYRPAVLKGVEPFPAPDIDATSPGETYEDVDIFHYINTRIAIDADWTLFLGTTIRNPLGKGEMVSKFLYSVPGVPAGSLRIAFFTAVDPQHGGIGWFYREWAGPIPGDPVGWIEKYVEEREIVIEVLPREDSTSGSD